MLGFLKKFLDFNYQQISRYQKIVAEINNLESDVRVLKDKDFAKETQKLKDQVQSGEKTLDEVLPYAFALVREAARRVLAERHYDVQLMAGIALHEGKIAEQKTGEGKTLSSTTALYLNALTGKGVHVVTVNDYLARRDCGWMGTVFNFLGMTTSAIMSQSSYIYDPQYLDETSIDWRLMHLKPVSRKEAYKADIVYGVNSEFGFDYLRDNMVRSSSEKVQNGFNFVVIDEVDSVLIDEARTPLIISAPFSDDVSKYYEYAKLVKKLDPEKDFIIDEKRRSVHLTEEGIKRIESLLGVDNLYEKDYETLFFIEAALKAETLFKRDKDYIVRDGQVVIVDEFTGRLLEGRRFSEGLHQAIEAKEGVAVQQESKTLAVISIQNYFRQYKKLSGMTGTAATEAEEFNKIYNADVVVIPTNKPVIRQDKDDLIYKTQKAKYNAIVAEIAKAYQMGRPVLVGTSSIEKNEYLSSLLTKAGIKHNVLNAKNHEKEAKIIAQAGKKGAVTVATNMAGRGVDIVLGGEAPSTHWLKTRLLKAESDKQRQKLQEEFNKQMLDWQNRRKEVVELGGLYVIGTEKHESRRIDNQLRGRSGRQGDPGESRFFVSLEDDLMRIFGGEQIANVMNFLKLPEDQPIENKMVTRIIVQAQIKVEGFNFDIRKNLVEFDDVLNKQRQIVYDLRSKIIHLSETSSKKLYEHIQNLVEEEANILLNNYYMLTKSFSDKQLDDFTDAVISDFPFLDKRKAKKIIESSDSSAVYSFLISEFKTFYKKNQDEYKEIWSDVVKNIYLDVIDKYWIDHLTAIESLREGIGLRGHGQLDPLIEYKNEAYRMFEDLLNTVNLEFIKRLSLVKIEKVEQVKESLSSSTLDQQQLQYSDPAQIAKQSLGQNKKTVAPGSNDAKKKIGRNDPCWCGSGKKYKKCHYPN
ncbi:MAG: protein translocase subunit SecA [Patescibacteria group bacterium]|nr:MAG: protein translocase subunit SecA [Patescibacteria group bacterium]